MSVKQCVVVVAHGSGRREHSELVEDVVRRLSMELGGRVWLGYLEGSEHGLKSIPEAVLEAVNEGCRELIIAPFFLTPGRHVLEDVPREVSKALSGSGVEVRYVMAECIGRHEGVVRLLLDNILRAAERLSGV